MKLLLAIITILSVSCGAQYDTDPNIMSETVDLCNVQDGTISNIVTTNKADFTQTLINGEFEAGDNYYFCTETDEGIKFALCNDDGSIWDADTENPDFDKCLEVKDLPQ